MNIGDRSPWTATLQKLTMDRCNVLVPDSLDARRGVMIVGPSPACALLKQLVKLFRTAITRLTMNNSNPKDNNQAVQRRPLKGKSTTLGQGYATAMNAGLDMALNILTTSNDGTHTSTRIMLALSLQELAESLSTKQSAGIGFLDVFGIEEKTEFATSLRISTYSLCIVVHAKKYTSTSCVKKEFTPEAIKLIPHNEESASLFARYYGDTYVNSISTGGEYIGVLHFECSSRREQEKLEQSLKASGILKDVQLGAETQDAINKAIDNTKVTCIFSQYISGLKNPETPGNAKELVDFARRFASTNLDSPTTIAIDLMGYEHVPPATTGNTFFEAIAHNRAQIFGDIINPHGLIEQKWKLLEIQNQIRSLQSIHLFYHPLSNFTDSSLEEKSKMNKNDIDAINKFLKSYDDHPSKSLPDIKLPSLLNGAPVLAFTQTDTHLGPWGEKKPSPGDYSEFRDIEDVATSIMKRTAIKRIQLRSGEWIDKLTTEYQNLEGDVSRELSCQHGGNGGSEKTELVFSLMGGYNDFITEISGNTDGERLSRLKITSKNRSTEGGLNKYGGPAFTENFLDGRNRIPLGFFGRASETEVNQLGIISVTLLPSIWEPLPS